MFRDGMEDMAFERLKDLQRERENSRLEEGATFRLLGLLTGHSYEPETRKRAEEREAALSAR